MVQKNYMVTASRTGYVTINLEKEYEYDQFMWIRIVI